MAKDLRVIVMVLWLVLPSVTLAQFPGGGATLVQDPWLLAQMVIQVGHSLELVNLAIRDLAAWSSISEALAVVTDLELLITDVNAIAARITGRQGIWNSVQTLPTTMAGFGELRRNLTAVCRTSAEDGLSAQGIIARLGPLLQRLQSLIRNLTSILGTVAGLQAANTVMSEINGHLAALTAVTTATNEPMLCQRWADEIKRQALEELQFRSLSDYGIWPTTP